MCSLGMCLPDDRISSLSDDILLVILSFLSFKEVVKTSLLSRRWLNLWVHTSVLHFHALVPKVPLRGNRRRRNYVKWVNRVLLKHKGQYLKDFKIVCDLDGRNQKDIDSWLVFALAKKVECLELNLRMDYCDTRRRSQRNNYVFPDLFLNYSSDKSQFLQFDFKCLKSLSLERVDVTGEGINFFLLNCPFIERLEVVGSSTLVNLVISDPTLVLKYLKINDCCRLKVLSISNFNLVSLVMSSFGDLTLTCLPNLVSLDISSFGDLTLTGLPMLVELFIFGILDRLSHSISKASCFFSQLEALTLSGVYLKDVIQLSNYNQLTKLKRLVIGFGAEGDESLTQLISILNSCPRLEEFVLRFYHFKATRPRRNTHEVERCDSSLKNKSLKVFEFFGYYGHVRDDELIMHVVENAVCLEKIIIDPCDINLIGPHLTYTKQAYSELAYKTKQEDEARSIALQRFEGLRKAIPSHVHLHLR